MGDVKARFTSLIKNEELLFCTPEYIENKKIIIVIKVDIPIK
jgi:hypothetical protein